MCNLHLNNCLMELNKGNKEKYLRGIIIHISFLMPKKKREVKTMYIIKENQRLYLSTWKYNAARIFTELAKVVENHNGRVKPLRKAIISNRTLDSTKREYKERLEHLIALEKENHKEIRVNAIKKYTEDLEALEKINNEPITVTHAEYITFVLDDFYYRYQVSDNPLFDFLYVKTPIENGKYCVDARSTEDKKEWLYDCFFHWDCSNEDIKEAANLIFNMLVCSRVSDIYSTSEKKRVPNTYNGGYHYEEVVKPKRMREIDF